MVDITLEVNFFNFQIFRMIHSANTAKLKPGKSKKI